MDYEFAVDLEGRLLGLIDQYGHSFGVPRSCVGVSLARGFLDLRVYHKMGGFGLLLPRYNKIKDFVDRECLLYEFFGGVDSSFNGWTEVDDL